jgi:formamidopyrimidine-DNA glycosylase
MPELPDVEVFRSYLAHTILHKDIKQITIPDTDIIKGSPRTYQSLQNDSFETTHRHGKYCFLKRKSGTYVVLHFGMTGNVAYYTDEQPQHARFIVTFSDGHRFAFLNMRKLGHITLAKSIESFLSKKGLGPDADAISTSEIKRRLQSKRGSIKNALMDQKTIAGIGNIYSDEILYHAGVHPKRKIDKLSESEIDSIAKYTKQVLQKAIEKKSDPQKMPSFYLLGRRNTGAKCGFDTGTIQRLMINGRGAYFCTKHQH